MLSRRSHSKRELKKKLEERGYDHAPVEHVLTRLEQVGLQSDQEFALVFARGKWRQSQWGPGKIRKVWVPGGYDLYCKLSQGPIES